MNVMARRKETTLIEGLPQVRGRYRENAPLAGVTWFQVGGPAEVMFRPADTDDLAQFLRHKPADVPVTVIGVGSNLLVRDGGVPGVVVRLGRGFVDIAVDGKDIVCGAGCLDANVAATARDAGIAGLEFLCGVPGTIGGALRMNAGAYERETKDILVEAQAIDPHGEVHALKAEELGMTYRHSSLPCDWIFVKARFRGTAGDRDTIAAKMAEIQGARGDTQPIRSRTGGSTFKNPPGHKAWELIDKAGCRGLRRGAAMVSEQHCNFLINTGGATAADLEFLGEEVRSRVFQASGIRLEWEIRRIGLPIVPRDWGGGL
jgi:UDP-N-acetylmuramate dehydrogenase